MPCYFLLLRDLPIVKRNWENMLREEDQVSKARLLATTQKESGVWLNALPVSSLGSLLQKHFSLNHLYSKRWECMVGPLESSWEQ